MGREVSYTKAFVMRFWVRCMAGWLMSASSRSVGGVSPAAVATLWNIISKASQAEFELQAYVNGLVNGLVIGFSDSIGRIRRLGMCVPTRLTVVWALYKT